MLHFFNKCLNLLQDGFSVEVHTSKLAHYLLVKYFHRDIPEQNITSLKLVYLQCYNSWVYDILCVSVNSLVWKMDSGLIELRIHPVGDTESRGQAGKDSLV